MQRALEDVRPAVELARLLALGDQRPVAGWREERRNAGAGRAHPLGERALRDELDLDLLLQELSLELLVLADVGRNHLPHLPRLEQQPDAEVVGTGVVADDREVFGATPLQRGDEVFWNTREAEAAHHD